MTIERDDSDEIDAAWQADPIRVAITQLIVAIMDAVPDSPARAQAICEIIEPSREERIH